MKSLIFVTCALSAAAAFAETKVWNTKTGGDINTDENWTPVGVPGAADTLGLRDKQSAPLTMSESLTVGADLGSSTQWYFFPGNQFHGELALGEGHVLELVNGYRFRMTNASKPRLTSGTLKISKGAAGNLVIVESTQHDFEFKVDGSTAKFEVDSSMSVNTYASGTNWWFRAVNGGEISAGFALGYTGGSYAHIGVSGEGSKWTTAADSYIGRHGHHCSLEVTDQGTASAAKNLYLGRHYNCGYSGRGGSNWATVDAGTLTVGTDFILGYDTLSNRLEVLNGGKVTVGRYMFVGHSISDSRQVGGSQCPNNNEVLVSGSGSSLQLTTDNLFMPYKVNAHDLKLTVTDGATVQVAKDIKFGDDASCGGSNSVIAVSGGASLEARAIYAYGHNNAVAVDNATMNLSNALEALGDTARFTISGGAKVSAANIYFGATAEYLGSNNVLTISGGSSVTSQWIRSCGHLNTVVVDNSEVVLSEGLNMGGGSTTFASCDDTISIKGKDVRITAPRIQFMSHTLVDVEVPEGGFTNPLFLAGSYFSFAKGTAEDTKIKIRVRFGKNFSGKHTFTLFKSTGVDVVKESQGFPANVEWDLPEGSTVDMSDKKIIKVTVKKSQGLAVIFR